MARQGIDSGKATELEVAAEVLRQIGGVAVGHDRDGAGVDVGHDRDAVDDERHDTELRLDLRDLVSFEVLGSGDVVDDDVVVAEELDSADGGVYVRVEESPQPSVIGGEEPAALAEREAFCRDESVVTVCETVG